MPIGNRLLLVEIPTNDGGTEVLWAEATGENLEISSVPVFVYGISRGTKVAASAHGDRRRMIRVLEQSSGATIRCYLPHDAKAADTYETKILPAAGSAGLRIGPATLF